MGAATACCHVRQCARRTSRLGSSYSRASLPLGSPLCTPALRCTYRGPLAQPRHVAFGLRRADDSARLCARPFRLASQAVASTDHHSMALHLTQHCADSACARLRLVVRQTLTLVVAQRSAASKSARPSTTPTHSATFASTFGAGELGKYQRCALGAPPRFVVELPGSCKITAITPEPAEWVEHSGGGRLAVYTQLDAALLRTWKLEWTVRACVRAC